MTMDLRAGPCARCGKRTLFFCQTQYNDPDNKMKAACAKCGSVWVDDPGSLPLLHKVPNDIKTGDYNFIMSEEGSKYINSVGTIEDIYYVMMLYFRRKGIAPRFITALGGMMPQYFQGFWAYMFWMPDCENILCIRENYNNMLIAGVYQKAKGIGAEYNYTEEEIVDYIKLIFQFVVQHGDNYDFGYPSIMLLSSQLDDQARNRIDQARDSLARVSQNYFSSRYGYPKTPYNTNPFTIGSTQSVPVTKTTTKGGASNGTTTI